MKNSTLIIFIILYQILFLSKGFSNEIEFSASDIEIKNNQNLTIANNATATIKDDGIIIEGIKIEYFKDRSLIIVNNGKISKIDKSLSINSDIFEYSIDEGKLDFIDNVDIKDKKNNLIIYSDKIYYDINNQIIFGQGSSKILDEFNNTYDVSQFEYSVKNRVIKLSNAKVLDKNKNSIDLEIAYLDLIKKELVAKDIGLNFKISENSENEPRLKGRSLVSDENNTIVKKGTFTFCKKREKCPPWEMRADEIKHDKNKKIIYYKNASLKVYDQKVFIFQNFSSWSDS